jgi:GNAT superfamily N-acetyltransferase
MFPLLHIIKYWCRLILLVAAANSLSVPISKFSMTTTGTLTPSDVTFQEITKENASLLWEFLSIAAHEDDMSVVKSNPALARYAAEFDVRKDFGFIAYYMDHPEYPLGAVWARQWDDPQNRGFAFVSDDIPEIAFGVRAEHQGKGIGTALLQKLLEHASCQRHVPAVSLSVRDSNPALRLYERSGFRRLVSTPNRVGGQSFTMVKIFDHDTIVLRSVIYKDDIPSILSLIHKKAEFDMTMADSITPLTVSEDKLNIALLQKQHAHVILAERAEGGPIGMVLYYYRFSSFSGQPHLWLEDLFVNEECRGHGVGTMLLHRLAEIANASNNTNCSHIGWVASARNTRGLLFCEKMGAQIVEQHGNRYTFQWRTEGNSRIEDKGC